MSHGLSDALFDIKEKMTDEEYKTIMEIVSKVFKERKSTFYKITHLVPRFMYCDGDDEDDDGFDYYKFSLIPTTTILQVSAEYPEKIFEDVIPNALRDVGYSYLHKETTQDLLNGTSDTGIRDEFYHIIKIERLEV